MIPGAKNAEGLLWIPPPRYLLRKQCVLRLLSGKGPCRVLEIGCGAGDLLKTLAGRGHTGIGLELSDETAAIARQTLGAHNRAFEVRVADYEDLAERFDVLMAFDVLEHIEDDEKALAAWRALLRPEGLLLISVPAHQARWGSSDTAVGHFRRYEKEGLRSLVERSGFRIERLWCYGFPLSNVVARVAAILAHRQGLDTPGDRARRTERSGLIRESDARLIRWLAPPAIVAPFAWLQMLFVSLDLGTGYLALASAVGRQDSNGGCRADG